MIPVTSNEVKKDLYKSKVNAKFSHYAGGKLIYNVELSDGRIYQFPISSVVQKPSNIYELIIIEHGGNISQADNDTLKSILGNKNYHSTKLAEDLGNTAFSAEIKASELNRWISKAIEAGDFICINKAPELVETNDERSNPAGTV